MASTNGELDISTHFKVHAVVVGVYEILFSITSVVLGNISVTENENTKFFISTQPALLYIGIAGLVFSTFYWIGFFGEFRYCLTIFLIYLLVRIIYHAFSTYSMFVNANQVGLLATLFVLGVLKYETKVANELQKSFRNRESPATECLNP